MIFLYGVSDLIVSQSQRDSLYDGIDFSSTRRICVKVVLTSTLRRMVCVQKNICVFVVGEFGVHDDVGSDFNK